ncbi:hypothetical protein IAU60_003789 [Kwoniella sp. DSM 27419]
MPVPTTKPLDPPSTYTPIDLLTLPSKDALRAEFVGKHISTLRTPAIILDRKKFRANCELMAQSCQDQGLTFRAHVKTHKTAEGLRYQLEAGQGSSAVVCSTLIECWQICRAGLVESGLVKDMLYGLPCSLDKMDDLVLLSAELERHGAILRLMIDHPGQLAALGRHPSQSGQPWSIFIKVDGGGVRAGLPAKSPAMRELISTAISMNHIDIFGFYSHFGQSYASSGPEEAADYLAGEVACVSTAAQIALDLGAKPSGPYVLSVGATPTAHVVEAIKSSDLPGVIELHAGNYCCLDLQQYATKLVPLSRVSTSVLTHVISSYPHRHEAMCDAAALAMARDAGPIAGYGRVVWPESARGWDLGRMSQEHGTLVRVPPEGSDDPARELELGELLRIVGQHSCVTLAAHPWYYCVDDGGDIVQDVWVPWKGW